MEENFTHLLARDYFKLLLDKSNVEIRSIPLTLSWGIAFYPEHGQNYQQLRAAVYKLVLDQGSNGVVAVD